MNKKTLVIVTALLVCSLVITPFVLATPRVQKKNTTIHTFEFNIQGGPDPETGREWFTPKPPDPPEFVHQRKKEWRDDTVVAASLEVDEVMYDLSYHALVDADINLATMEAWITVHETITLLDESGSKIGSLKITSMDLVNFITFEAWGRFEGHGTGALGGVKVFGTSSLDGMTVVRTGAAINWPDLA